MSKLLCIDLCCGLGGWTEGFLAEDYDVVGFDIERHRYGSEKYPGQLVLQDVLTVTGHQFKGKIRAIVASPSCTQPSYRAMPWSRAKALNAIGPPHEFIELFNACFRIAQEADVPIVIENVKGAQPWIGRARAHFGSFYLWGDVGHNGNRIVAGRPLQMNHWLKANGRTSKNGGGSWFNIAHNTESGHGQNPDGRKLPGFRFDGSGKSFQSESVKVSGLNWSGSEKPGYKARAFNTTALQRFGWAGTIMQEGTSGGQKRKAASAKIAKIPFPLASYIARCFKALP